MSQHKRQTIKSTVYTYVGVVVGFLTRVLLFPALLTTAQIGCLDLIARFGLILGQVGSLGFTSGMVKYFPYFRNDEKKHHGFFFITMVVALMGIVSMSVLLAFGKSWFIALSDGKSPLFEASYDWLYPVMSCFLVFTLVDVYARLVYQSSIGAFLKEFGQRIFILTATVAALPLLGFDGFLVSYIVALCLPTFLLIAFLFYKRQAWLTPNWEVLKSEHRPALVKRSLYGLLTGVGYLGLLNVDALMINQYLGEDAVGVYSTVFYFTTLILIPSRSVYRVASTVVSDAMKANDWSKIAQVYKDTCLFLFIAACILYAGVAVNTHNILAVLGPNFNEGWGVLIFVGLGAITEMGTGINHIIIENSAYYRFSTYSVVFLIISAVLFNIWLIPMYGILGAAIGTFLSTVLFNIGKYLFILYKFKLQPWDMRYLIILGWCAGWGALIYWMPSLPSPYVDAPLKGLAVLITYIPFFYKMQYSPELNALINKGLRLVKR